MSRTNAFLYYSLRTHRCVHSVQFENTLSQFTETYFELFLAQQIVLKACQMHFHSSALNHPCCSEIQHSYLFGCDTHFSF